MPGGRRRKETPLRKTQTSSTRVAAYLRVSTEEQADSGLGLEAQRLKCIAMAMVKDWPEPIFYKDEGVSGTKNESGRPGLAKLLSDIQLGKFDAVITSSLDRLGRTAKIVIDLIDSFRSSNISLISCKESFDASTPHGQFSMHLFAALAQLERDQTAQRTREALFAKSQKDGERGGRMPYGYRRVFDMVSGKDGQRLKKSVTVEIDQDAAEIIRKIFSLRYSNGWTLAKIAMHLNSKEIATARGGDWWPSTLQSILDNEQIYRGGVRGESNLSWPIILLPLTM